MILSGLVSCAIAAEVDGAACRFPESRGCQSQALLQISMLSHHKNATSGEANENANLVQFLSLDDFYAKAMPKLPVSPPLEASLASKLKLIHVTKACGSALEKWGLDNGFTWGWYWLHGKQNEYGSPTADTWHTPPRYFKKNPYEGYETFIVVRDPYARMISEFRCPWTGYYGVTPDAKTSADVNMSSENKEEWNKIRMSARAAATVDDMNAWLIERLQRGAARPPFGHGHMVPQYLYIYGADGKEFVKPSNVLHVENIDDDFTALRQRYKMTGGPLPHINDSEMRKFAVTDLSQLTRRLIEKEYSEDFDRLGYPKLSGA
jgi:hypothetical protein